MTLHAGARLGPYQILAPLGSGAMGDVYRARDARLSRDVAVKVLPAALAADAERLERFEREARAAGLFNHPNILAVYDAGTHDGAPYLVSELLEGETLRERIAGQPLPPRKALDYALQIAQGLAAAHEKGIVHRDLKPENLFVTRDGRVKILDFGLAKLTEKPEEERAHDQDRSPTSSGTSPGVVLGTAEYMSPEQVRGRPADHRSDVFSLGVVLHEMLTGRRAFQRETPADTMSAILREDAPDLAGTNRNLPAGLEAIVSHCIERLPEERFQSARDLAFNLEAVARAWAPSSTSLAPLLAPRRLLWPVVAGLALVAGIVAGFLLGSRSGHKEEAVFRRLTFRRGTVTAGRFAPDGASVVYAAAWDGNATELFQARPESPESRSLGLPSADILAVSSRGEMALLLDRQYVRGFVYSGTLARAPLGGGAPRPVMEGVQGADWSPDGQSLAIVRDFEGHSRLEFPPGNVLYETGGYVSHARISPDGRLVAFLDHPLQSDDGGAVAVVGLTGKRTTLSSGWLTAGGLAWSPSGAEVWFTAGRVGMARGLHAVSLAGSERLVHGMPGAVTLHDIAPSGRVLVAREDFRRESVGLAPGETRERNLSWLDWSFASDLSTDGRQLLFSERGEGGGTNSSVYLRPTSGAPAVRLGEGISTELSPDGRWALAVQMSSPAQLVLLPTGTGEPRPFTKDAISHQWAAFSPDGRRVVFTGNAPGHAARLYVQDLAGGDPRPFGPEGVRSVWHPVAPDGNSVAAVGPDGRACVYPIDDGGPARPIPGFGPGDRPVRWTPDGRSLYVFRQGDVPARVYRLEVATGRREPWKELMPADPAGVNLINPILLTPDARSYVYSYRRILSDLYLVDRL